MSRYYVALGSNMGDRLAYLRAALRELKESGATVVRAGGLRNAAMGQDGSTGVFECGGVGGERSRAGGFFGVVADD